MLSKSQLTICCYLISLTFFSVQNILQSQWMDVTVVIGPSLSISRISLREENHSVLELVELAVRWIELGFCSPSPSPFKWETLWQSLLWFVEGRLLSLSRFFPWHKLLLLNCVMLEYSIVIGYFKIDILIRLVTATDLGNIPIYLP